LKRYTIFAKKLEIITMRKIICTLFFVFCPFFLFAQKADAILGTYLNTDGKSKIEFFKSGDTYSGKVVWLKIPNDENGEPRRDIHNPDKSLRDRPLMGMITIAGLKYEGDGKYVDGTAYLPTVGYEVEFKVHVNDDNTISVTGSKGILSETETWKKE
jgi:uncharacterized protein (DUF2147 family)